MTFDEAMPYIRTICRKWAYMFRLEYNELINEVWLRCDFSKFDGPRGFGMTRHIEYQIINYVRGVFGRPPFKGHAKRQRTRRLVGDVQGRFAGFDEIDSAEEFDKLISLLDPHEREVVEMRYRGGLNGKEIAVKLKIAPHLVSSRHCEALKHLREQVA